MLGQELGGRYGVVERLGMGGMGAVYKAINPRDGQEVAVKVLREAYAQHPAIRERFIREAEAGASLEHPNVVPLIDFGIEDDGRLWLAMEFVRGWTLRDEINHNGAFDVQTAVELMKQVLRGLAVAHDAGMIHRDLKHDNIMYFGRRDDFLARIVDFGVVKSAAADLDRKRPSKSLSRAKRALGQDQDGAFDLSAQLRDSEQAQGDKASIDSTDESLKAKALTSVGMMVGSPSYMAPEQIRGLKVGPPADLYALAVVVYEVLAARRLFTVNDYETLLREDAQREAPQLVFSARGELIPEAFSEIIHTALAHDPTDRYPDAHTMLLALDQMPRQESVLPPNLFCELARSEDLEASTIVGVASNVSSVQSTLGAKDSVKDTQTELNSEDSAVKSPMLFEGSTLSTHKSEVTLKRLTPNEDQSQRSSGSVSAQPSPARITLSTIVMWLTPFIVGLSAWFAVYITR